MSRKIIYAVYNFYYSYKYKHLFSDITANEISDLFLLGVRIWVSTQEVIYMAKRGENIRKRADGRWEGRYIEAYSSDGKAIYRSVYGRTYTETKEKLSLNKNLCNQNTGNKISMEELFREWLYIKESSIKISSEVTYRYFIDKHFIPHFKNVKAMYLTSELVQDFISKNSKLSPKTMCDMISLLIQIIKYGQSKKYINYFDFDSIIYPKSLKDELPVLKNSEFIKLVNYVQTNFEIQKTGILLSLFMGIRLGEICALQWEDVNFLDETIHIGKTMQRLKNLDKNAKTKTKIVIDTPKSQKSIRDIPIPSFLLELLKEYKSCNKSYILTGTTDHIEPRSYQKKFKSCLENARIPDTNFHSLRHTFATRAIEQGCDIKSLSEMLGHSSVKFTMERYVHPSNEHKKMNLEKLAVFY